MDGALPDSSIVKSSEETERPLACDVCGGPTIERHCKIICRRCGYTRDCSDP